MLVFRSYKSATPRPAKILSDSLTTTHRTRSSQLIAEHAHRINPVEIPKSISDLVIGVSSSKDVSSVADSEWVLSSPPSEYKKSFASLISKDKDRAIGFEGIPHESTGYYCEYENGVITSRSGSKAVSAPPSP